MYVGVGRGVYVGVGRGVEVGRGVYVGVGRGVGVGFRVGTAVTVWRTLVSFGSGDAIAVAMGVGGFVAAGTGAGWPAFPLLTSTLPWHQLPVHGQA